jgi:serine/threonine-protein kinase RsbT
MSPDDQVTRVVIRSARDLVTARQQGRSIASALGFSMSQATMIATAISELARNIVTYASPGEILLRADNDLGLVIVARDNGPGIVNVQAALQPGFSTAGGLGLGLPGVRRIADSFDIQSGPDGTTITMTKKTP